MNLPNKLTAGRIACTFLMIVFILMDGVFDRWFSLAMFIAAAVTDALDGYAARKYKLVTNLGKFLDPLADKILNYSVMILLVPEGLVPVLPLVLILFREFLVSGIRQSAVEQGRVIAANIFGKVKTIFQDVSLVAILLFRAVGVSWLGPVSWVLIWICAVLTVVSGAVYLVQNIDVLREK